MTHEMIVSHVWIDRGAPTRVFNVTAGKYSHQDTNSVFFSSHSGRNLHAFLLADIFALQKKIPLSLFISWSITVPCLTQQFYIIGASAGVCSPFFFLLFSNRPTQRFAHFQYTTNPCYWCEMALQAELHSLWGDKKWQFWLVSFLCEHHKGLNAWRWIFVKEFISLQTQH